MPLRQIRSPKRQAAALDRSVRRRLFKVMNDFATTDIVPTFEDIVSDWRTKVQFRIEKKILADEFRLFVKPTGDGRKVFTYVDKGTRAHIIRPKNAPKLSFIWGGIGSYKARTAPVARAHVGPGRVEGGSRVWRLVVHHPGFPARLFSETVHQEVTPKFRKVIEREFRKLADEFNRRSS